MKRTSLLSLCLGVFLLALPLGADTLVVDDDGAQCGTDSFPTIQSAINAASPGDVVEVCPGFYIPNPDRPAGSPLLIDKALTVRGVTTGTAPPPTLHGAFFVHMVPSAVVRITASDVTFEGFDVFNKSSVLHPGVLAPAIVRVASTDGSRLENVHILDNILREPVTAEPVVSLRAYGIDWRDAHGVIANNTISVVKTKVGKGLALGLFSADPSMPLDVLVEGNFITDANQGVQLNGVRGASLVANQIGNGGSTGFAGISLYDSHNVEISDNTIESYQMWGIQAGVLAPDDPVPTGLVITGNTISTTDPATAAVALRPAYTSSVSGNTFGNLGTLGDAKYAVQLGRNGDNPMPAEGNLLCDNLYEGAYGSETDVPDEILVVSASANNKFPGGADFAGNQGCLALEVEIDLRPGSTTNQINTNARQLVPIAILSEEGFDACLVDISTIVVRGAVPSSTRHACYDVDGDGDDDFEVNFRARSFEKPDPADCDDPAATIELEALADGGTEILGSDTVTWLGPDCK